ncbi:MAG: FxsA family protein [Parvularculaceae bacterium]
MLIILILLFVAGPIAEIAVLLAAGQAFGPLPVIAACIGTAVLGGVLIRSQGLAALNMAQRDLADGRIPVDAAVDGALLAVAAPLLMTPGFITDTAGFLLLVPPVRRALARIALKSLRARIVRVEETRF